VPHLASDFSKVSLFIFKDRICPKLRISTIGDPTPKMARLRTPLARAKLEGRDTKNPQRYRHNEPIAAALGDPPEWLNETQAEAWRGFEAELPGGQNVSPDEMKKNLKATRMEDRTDAHRVVGRFCQHTIITRDSTTMRVLERWPDKIGERINPVVAQASS
jgi:hypothetical protein